MSETVTNYFEEKEQTRRRGVRICQNFDEFSERLKSDMAPTKVGAKCEVLDRQGNVCRYQVEKENDGNNGTRLCWVPVKSFRRH